MQIRDPLVELHETKLYQYLASLDQEYSGRITTFVREIAPLMVTIKNYFPYYTRHDAHHGYQVVGRVAQCLLPSCFDPAQPEALTAQELFLLIAAAYAHDLGMAVFPGEEQALKTKLGIDDDPTWQTNGKLQGYLRRNHSSRGGEYIEKHAESFGVPRNLVAALDLLMKAHNYSITQLERELQRPFATGQKESDLAQLAVIVCVADAIEFSDTRVLDGVLDKIGKDESSAARVSYAENMKHVCTGDSLAVTDDGRIIVSGAFTNANVLALAHRTFDQMEEWIQGYSDIDRRCKQRKMKVRGEPFQRDLSFNGGDFQRLGVRLNKRSVIELIASNAIWRTQKGIALRELVQNAVEACRYRAHHSAPSDKYQPEVRVVFDRERHTATVSDNGCGMSERTVLNNFLTVGSSRSREAAYTESDYAPIARFGIGFWSVFTIADMATVSTAAFENYRGRPNEAANAQGFEFDVQLTELKDFTVFSPIETPCGTTITLNLKPKVIIDEVYISLKGQLVCSMVPLILVLDGAEEIVGDDIPDIDDNTLFGVRRLRAKELGVKVFHYRAKSAGASISYGLAYRIEGGLATFMPEPGVPMLSVLESFHIGQSAVCGFSVPVRVTPLCIDLPRIGTYKINATTPQGFEFSIDRGQLNNNEAAKQFIEDARKIIHDGYRAFLKETNSYYPEAINRLQREAALGGGNVYDQFTALELASAKANYPDLICMEFIPIAQGCNFSEAKHNAIFVNLTQLSGMDGIVFCLQAKRSMFSYRGGSHFPLESPQALEVAFKWVQRQQKTLKHNIPIYIAQPDRNFSLLFDNDSSSTVHVSEGGLCFLAVNLKRIDYIKQPAGIIPDIGGPWAGAIYWRKFDAPDNKPYLFLGRHRVLVKPGTPLQSHIQALAVDLRFSAISDIVKLLQEDEAGHKPEALTGLV
ncbi:HD domain-containing protein [Azotobacter beijerinckii]|uniref:HD domain-containing protein n=1 Tax=Azotobacter beijerinckii TaxID=170623 RepID=UPI002954B22B|nr:ATP-binding protein [Azotobacter beijerinckii]MDV7212467.1 ATP-binding protein [Azotobacter beijerinckii]